MRDADLRASLVRSIFLSSGEAGRAVSYRPAVLLDRRLSRADQVSVSVALAGLERAGQVECVRSGRWTVAVRLTAAGLWWARRMAASGAGDVALAVELALADDDAGIDQFLAGL